MQLLDVASQVGGSLARVSRASNSLAVQGHEASWVIVAHSGCGGVLWLRLLPPPEKPEAGLGAPGQGCLGAWDAARASCLRHQREEQTYLWQELQSKKLNLRVHK